MPPDSGEDEFFSGCIYGPDPEDDFYRLSPEDLRCMQLVGLPIRIEHKNTDCGKVVDSWVSPEGRAYVRWRFADTPTGWGLAKLVREGKVCELSLKHVEYDDGTKEALEVSVVEQGARPDTFIHRKPVRYIRASIRPSSAAPMEQQQMPPPAPGMQYVPVQYVQVPVQQQPVAAAVPQQAAVAAAPPPAAVPQQQAAVAAAPPAAAAAPPPAAAPQQVAAVPPALGEKRSAADPLDDDARRSKFKSDAQNFVSLAEQILPHLQDPALSQAFVGSLSNVLNNQLQAEEALASRGQMLEKAKNRDRELAKEIVDGIMTLMSELMLPGASVADEEKRRLMTKVYEENPDFARMSQPLVVAASRVASMRTAVAAAENGTLLRGAQDQLRLAQERLAAFGGQTVAASAPVPSWVPVPPAAAAPPTAVVAASARDAAPPAPQQQASALPDTLLGMAPYTGVVGKVRVQDIYTTRSG